MQDAQVVNVKGGLLGHNVQFSIGDQKIPVRKATIEIAPGDLITLTMSVRAGDIDLDVLQHQTHLVILTDETDDEPNTNSVQESTIS